MQEKLVDKLVEKCTENIEETKSVENENKYEKKCSSCTVYIVLFWITFTINIGIGIYFAYREYMNRNK